MILNLPFHILTISAFCAVIILYIRNKRFSGKIVKELKKSQKTLKRLNKLRDSMLEISQAIVGTEEPTRLYEMILSKAIDAIPNANVGSVLLADEAGLLRCAVQKGYDEKILKEFAIPLEETILWKYTKGDIKQTEVINDASSIEELKIKPLTADPEEWIIMSSITAPLFSEGKIIGLLNIDSKNKNAFTSDDCKAMEYMRSNIEVALQKHSFYSKMLKLSRFDELTGIFNRAYFLERFNSLHDRSERYNIPFCLTMFDINGLKKINDRYGHLAGDKLLKEFAQATTSSIRKSDIFARWGGDEFVILFLGIDREKIEMKMEKIKRILDETEIPINCTDKTQCQFSYGHAFYPTDAVDFKCLLKIADENMYQCKQEMRKDH